MALTRRKLLNAVARLGGAAAVYETLAAWDFLKAPPAMAAPFELARELRGGPVGGHSRRRRRRPVRGL